jgi:3-polyprenyl-4-hydroxybenzoate decarboxylase
MSERWQRGPAPAVVSHRERLLLVGPDGAVHQLEGASAELARAVLDLLGAPRSRDELLTEVTRLAGGPIARPAVLDELLELLRASGAIRVVAAPAREVARAPGTRIVVGVTGAIAAMHAPLLVAALQRRGCEVRVAVTRAGRRFVSVVGLEAMTHRRVARSMWSRDPAAPVPHLELASWADAVVVWPASATTLARLASGDFREVVAATALAARAPVVLAPAMNPAMLGSSAVKRNLARLVADGFHVMANGLAVEVADAPAAREARAGGTPSPEVTADVVVGLVRLEAAAARAPVDWERRYREHVPDEASPAADADLVAALAAHARPPGMLLDVGTGYGGLATHAARAGFTVVATDVSPTALHRARVAADATAVTWLVDDITRSRLETRFAVVVDRGCVDVLSERERVGWASTLARVARGVVLVKSVLGADAIARLLAPAFEAVEARASSFPRDRPAEIVVLRRRGEEV